MNSLRRLLALSGIRVSRTAVSVTLGTLTVVFGVGLMATAGYLISRAAERPTILSLRRETTSALYWPDWESPTTRLNSSCR